MPTPIGILVGGAATVTCVACLVTFINPGRLLRETNSIYREASGSVIQGCAGDAGFGVLRQASLERSNVNRPTELFALRNAREHYDAIKQILLAR